MSMSQMWNLWHGCTKKSEGCLNCYMYSIDAKHERNPYEVVKTGNFNLPIRKTRGNEYKFPSGTMFYTCFTSDFFVEQADEWRIEAWDMIKRRADCNFFMLTKRPERFFKSLPSDWGDGYDNVTIGVSCENQCRADQRLAIFSQLPIKHKTIALAPMIESIDIEKYLSSKIELVTCDGESGVNARPLDYSWVLSVREQCIRADVSFIFRQTGAKLIKNGKMFLIPKKIQHAQARKAAIDYKPGRFF